MEMSGEKPIYLDYNATTPVDPGVYAAMRPFLEERFGNPSSSHAYGKAAHDAVEQARTRVAALLGAKPGEIIFTGGGTEASNHAIKGAFFARLHAGFSGLLAKVFGASGGGHVIISAF